ncbi:hypothetical protein B0H15DRAFT_803267 [Mycena belliarum]|uniref:Uncharacterized protein n=1 Tax=Mycena belliarum TaxID=1033014 RepID=A0AAD6U2E8_9AGAR|nr:hypothetical protein B0H15DRAFT_803267 [Mycena belliae]
MTMLAGRRVALGCGPGGPGTSISRSRTGMFIKEGHNLPGKIRPVAWADNYVEYHMIFTTTSDETAFYVLKDLSEVCLLGHFNDLNSFWETYKREEQPLELNEERVAETSQPQGWMVEALHRAEVNLQEFKADMEKSGGRWWEVCAKSGKPCVAQLPSLLPELVASEKAMLL